ncbi:MAG: peptidoglycan editing factor PgeF [Rickettsiales bacterium]|nr:peptidoglycan editing factor PgeF [Rickettsiales bacterium]
MSIKFHFFGKDCLIDRALANRADLELGLVKKNISAAYILMLNQVHGKEVVVIDSAEKIYGTQGLPKADAIVTNLTNVVLGLFTADCAPILFFDEEKKIIAAAHAGWRGARLGVVESTIAAMRKLGATNIKAKIGPMIAQKSYEVSQDFFDDFLSEDLANKSFFLNGAKPDKHLFNLPSYIAKKLRSSGVEKIEISEIDTYESEEEFFSFRRSGHRGESDCGRNVSIIAL